MRNDVDGLHVEIELIVEFENIRYIDRYRYRYRFLHQLLFLLPKVVSIHCLWIVRFMSNQLPRRIQ